jgi:uncharacterized membrane protein (UPF0127 family)
MRTRRLIASAVGAVLIGGSVLAAPFVTGGAQAQPTPSTTITARAIIRGVSADRDVGEVEVAVTQGDAKAMLDLSLALNSAERERGLMWITSMPGDAGMLFVFPRDGLTGFWMKNTYLPLDIAFMSSQGTLVSVKQGVPLDTTILSPGAPYRYVIETNVGWWASHGFSPGAHVALPANLPAAS